MVHFRNTLDIVYNMKAAIEVIAGDAPMRAIARKMNVDHSTLTRRLQGGNWTALVDMARAFEVNPLPALLAAGVLSEADVAEYAAKYGLAAMSDVQLAQEILRRLTERDAPVLTEPMAHIDSGPQTVTAPQGEPLPSPRPGFGHDVADRSGGGLTAAREDELRRLGSMGDDGQGKLQAPPG